MRILIVGAGALGGLAGAFLARAGEDVTMLEVNAARAKVLNEGGLQITQFGQPELRVPLRVVTSVEGLEPFELVFIAVKTYQTEDAVRAAMPAVGPGTRFLSMQNGVGNTETIARLAGPERVLCGITYHSVQHSGPGRVNFRAGVKPIQIAPFTGAITPEIEAIGAMFSRAGLDTNVVPNIDHTVWQKLLHNAVINPVSAVTGLTCREILADEELLAFMRDLCDEILAVMRARGIPIVDEEDPFRPLIGSLKALGKNRPTMWQDLARGARTEVDALNGAVVAEAAKHGLRAPHNAALVHFIHSRERQKFLNKQEIATKLGLESVAGPDGARPRGLAKPTARASLRSDASGPVLESTRRLKELIHDYYRDVDAASDDLDRMVAACSALGPVEIVRALGIVPYFPENHAVLISATHQGSRFLARAQAVGYSQFVSAAMRSDIGALLDGHSPLVTAHGIKAPPRPDVVVYSTNTGHELLRWFEFYGAYYDVPVIGVHPPPALDALQRIDVDAATLQLLHLIEQIEQVTHRTLDMDRLGEAIDYSNQAAQLWSDILDLTRAVPAPMTFFDQLVHLAPMLLLRGTREAVAYYRELKAEVEDRVERGFAAVPGERHRFYWDGPPMWYAMRPLADLFAAHGTAVVASTFCRTFALPGLDPLDPVESMARTYTGVFGNRSEKYKEEFLTQQFAHFGVDAAVYHDCRTTPEASHARYGLAVRTEHATGVCPFVVEADSHDERLFSLDRLREQLTEFMEEHATQLAAS